VIRPFLAEKRCLPRAAREYEGSIYEIPWPPAVYGQRLLAKKAGKPAINRMLNTATMTAKRRATLVQARPTPQCTKASRGGVAKKRDHVYHPRSTDDRDRGDGVIYGASNTLLSVVLSSIRSIPLVVQAGRFLTRLAPVRAGR
jgi:hypothetical protein